MSTLALERAAVEVPQGSNLDVELATRAKKVLGYSVAANEILKQNAETEKYRRIYDAFKAIGIEPFTNESVERYKEAKLEEINKGTGLTEWANSEGGYALFMLSLAALIISISLLLWTTPQHFWAFLWFGPVVCTAVCVGIISIGVNGPQETFKWASTSLYRYTRPIPQFAMSHAIELKQLCPDVRFYVEELKADRVADPFLIANIGGDQYYIDVWDEPAFEGRLTK